MSLIIRTIQLFKHPPFPGKMILFQAFEHPHLKLLFQYPNTHTYGGRRTSTILWQSLQSSNRGCQMCTSLQQSLQSSNRGCQMCNSLRQSLQRSNGGSCPTQLSSLAVWITQTASDDSYAGGLGTRLILHSTSACGILMPFLAHSSHACMALNKLQEWPSARY